MKEQPSPGEGEDRLEQLDLTDARHAAHCQPGVPGKEPEVHRHHGQVREARPRSLRVGGRYRPEAEQGEGNGQRKGDHDGPGDRLPPAQFPAHDSAFGISERRRDHRAEQKEVADGEVLGVGLRGGQCCDCANAEGGEEPVARRRAITDAQQCPACGCRWKESDDDGPVTGRCVTKRQAGEGGEAEHHAADGAEQRLPMVARRTLRLGDHENGDGNESGDHGTTERNEHPTKFANCYPSRRERHTETNDADEAEQEPARFSLPSGSVTLEAHGER